jgi:hypothetical protein
MALTAQYASGPNLPQLPGTLAEARTALKGKVLYDALLKGAAFGVAEAKYWDRPLDKALTGAGDAFNNKNAAYQIAF